jgi:transcriptional regulator with XRE-family HTH domain
MKGDQIRRRLCDAIRQRREGLSVSQEAFADRLGLHRTYYSAIERGERNITLNTLGRIADGLDVKLSALFAEAGL